MTNHSSIIVRKLILVGHRKDYQLSFEAGINIIYGDSATGKSSILELINYLLGSSKFIYDEEIETSVKYAALEVELNGVTYSVKRDIFSPNKQIEVYASDFSSVTNIFPKKYAPNYSAGEGEDGFFSDFLLESLNLPVLKVREAPSQSDSPMIRLSFRDLFKYLYLKQDDVGSKQLLSIANGALYSKNKQTFRYIFNLLDSSITELEQDISNVSTKKAALERKYKSVSEFLRETQIETAINLSDQSNELQAQANLLSTELQRINSSMVANNETYSFLKDSLDVFSIKLMAANGARKESQQSVERFSRLKNDYISDIEKLKGIQNARIIIGVPTNAAFNCPICDTQVDLACIKEAYKIDESDKANHEINALTRRIRDLDNLIQGERDKLFNLNQESEVLAQDQAKARQLLDEESQQMITPYLSERDGIAAELATVNEKIRQSGHLLKIRNQQQLIFAEIEKLEFNIAGLQEKLSNLRKDAPSITEILESLGDLLRKFLVTVNIKDPRNIAINSSNFLPILRNRNYVDITSGGLRTILSIGYFLSLFEQSFLRTANMPAFLMIDTVGKYLGKTQSKYNETVRTDDEKENVSDPLKYSNMYEYMISLADRAAVKGIPCQIILVDNDVPLAIQQKYAGFVTAHFSSEGENGLPFGLIDDAHLQKN
ncbi:MAG: exonuclease SbcC [Pseudomonadota bacterium]